MNVITINEFNTNQNHFLEMAKKGMDLMLKSAIFGNFRIVPIASDDTTEECIGDDIPNAETVAAINEAKEYIASIKNGAEITEKDIWVNVTIRHKAMRNSLSL